MHLGIAHEEETDVRPPVNNILSQSVADVKPLRTGRTGTRGGGIVSEVAALPPSQPRGMLARLGELPISPREGGFIPRTVIQNLGLQPREEGQPHSVFRPETRVEAAAGAEIFKPSMSSRGISPQDIDTSTLGGLFNLLQSLQKTTKRGITPKGQGRVKLSDINSRMKFIQERLELFPSERSITDEERIERDSLTEQMSVLDQIAQNLTGTAGVRKSKAEDDAADEARILKLTQELSK